MENFFPISADEKSIYRAKDVDSGWIEMQAQYPRRITGLTAVLVLTNDLNCTQE
jgi:hypothetical protein